MKGFPTGFLRGFLSTILSISMVVACLWLVKLIAINLPEWKGSPFDFFYESKVSISIAVTIVIVGIFINTRGSED